MNRLRGRLAREPGFLGGEAQHRREPAHRGAEQVVEHGEAGLARRRGIRIAIERVLADVEIERREIDRHEGAERGEDALVVEIGIGLADQRIEFGKPMQHQPLELRHLLERDAVGGFEMREIAEHPAQRVAQLAIGVDRGFEDFRPDAQIVGIIGRAHPHAQNVGAGLFDHVLRRGDVAERLRHFAPVLVEHEAVREHDVERRAAARAAALQQRRLKPAAMLVGAFQIHHRLVAAVGLALDVGESRESAAGLPARRRASSRNRTRRRECRRLSASLRWRACRGSARARRARTRRRRPRPRRPRRCGH